MSTKRIRIGPNKLGLPPGTVIGQTITDEALTQAHRVGAISAETLKAIRGRDHYRIFIAIEHITPEGPVAITDPPLGVATFDTEQAAGKAFDLMIAVGRNSKEAR